MNEYERLNVFIDQNLTVEAGNPGLTAEIPKLLPPTTLGGPTGVTTPGLV
jgi:hypothetical protein